MGLFRVVSSFAVVVVVVGVALCGLVDAVPVDQVASAAPATEPPAAAAADGTAAVAPKPASNEPSFPPKSIKNAGKNKNVDLQAQLFDLKNENTKLKLAIEGQISKPTLSVAEPIADNAATPLQAAAQDRERSVQDAITQEETAAAASAAAALENEQASKNSAPVAPDDSTNGVAPAADIADKSAAASTGDVAGEGADKAAAATDAVVEGEAVADAASNAQGGAEVSGAEHEAKDEQKAAPEQAEEVASTVDEKKKAETTAPAKSSQQGAVAKTTQKIIQTIDEKFGKLAKIVGINVPAMKKRAAAPQARRTTKSLVLATIQDEGATPEAFLANCTRAGYDDTCCEAVLRGMFATFTIGISYAMAQGTGACPTVDVDCTSLRTTLNEMGTCPASLNFDGESVNAQVLGEAWDEIESEARSSLSSECSMISDNCEVSSWKEHAEEAMKSPGAPFAGGVTTALLAALAAAVTMAF